MATPPRLVLDDGELELDAAVGPSRRRFHLSDRAEALLRDLNYGNADLVPWVTARALVLAGGATLPALDTLREHVRRTGLSEYVDPEELRGRAGRVGGLNDIARDPDG